MTGLEITTPPVVYTPSPASPTTTTDTTTPPLDTTILPTGSHRLQLAETTICALSPVTSAMDSLDVDLLPVVPASGGECLDNMDVNTEKGGATVETCRTKRISKPSTRNDTANAISSSQKENKHPLGETSSEHGSK